MEEKKWCVYKHISPSNKVYIGITSQKPEIRWGNNGRCYKTQSVFYRAIEKYGWDNIRHEILFENLSHEEAVQKEIELIKEYKSNCSKYHNPMYGYNQTDGGEGQSGYVFSQERKDWLSQKMKGNGNPFYNKSHTEETKKKIASLAKERYKNPEDNPNYGNRWDDEQRQKASGLRIGNITSEKTKNKLSMSMSGENNPMYGKCPSYESIRKNRNSQPNTKRVKCVEQNVIFQSVSECARYFNTSAGAISSACRRGHISQGYHFEYIDNKEDKINRQINMYDKEMNYIKSFNSPKDASAELNIRIESIWNALRGDTKTAHGYIWRYADEKGEEYGKDI